MRCVVRIGIFSDSINIPPKEGINVHTYSVACALAERPGVDVVLIVCDRGWLDLDILSEQPFDTLVVPSSEFYDHEKIIEIIKEQSLDVLQTYMVYFAAIVLGRASFSTKVPMCVEFHDLEKTIVPLYLTDKHAIDFHDELQRQAGDLASLVRVMSVYDYEIIKKQWPEMKPVVRWMPVNIKGPSSIKEQGSRFGGVLFIGNTSYPPNAVAAEYIQKELAPHLAGVEISLVGRGTERYETDTITTYGIIDQISDVLQNHNIGLAPIFEGSGMKIKLLDYLSAGLPVVTTSVGAHGYPSSEAIIIEDDMTQWPTRIRALLANPSELARLSQSARGLFLGHFDLERTIDHLIEIYEQLTYRAVKTPSAFTDRTINQSDIYWLSEMRESPRSPVERQYLFKRRD